jgi:hypothetical protein
MSEKYQNNLKFQTGLTDVKSVEMIWLGSWYTFQTFKELDEVEDKMSYTQEVRDLLEEDSEEADNGSA